MRVYVYVCVCVSMTVSMGSVCVCLYVQAVGAAGSHVVRTLGDLDYSCQLRL